MNPSLGAGRVLVARLDSLGDVLLTGGAVRAVAKSASSVTMLVGAGRTAGARLLPGVDEVIEFAAGWVDFDPPPLDPGAVQDLVDRVRTGAYDSALIFTSYHQSPLPLALLLRLAGVGWVGAVSEDYPGSLLDLRHRVPAELPEAERALSLAVAAGFTPDAEGARLAVRQPLPDVASVVGGDPGPGDSYGLGQSVLSPDVSSPYLPSPYVVVHPGAAVAARRPSVPTARRHVAALVEAGRRVVVTGTLDEAAVTAAVAGGQARDLGGRLDLSELAAVLAGAEAVVAPNTGPAHLAAAVGTPVVSLFAPVVAAANWAPYGVPCVVLGDQAAPCHGSRARVCPLPGHPCLDDITGGEVVAAVDAVARRALLTEGMR